MKFCVPVMCVPDSVLVWRHCDA